jgi:hypothetical protein
MSDDADVILRQAAIARALFLWPMLCFGYICLSLSILSSVMAALFSPETRWFSGAPPIPDPVFSYVHKGETTWLMLVCAGFFLGLSLMSAVWIREHRCIVLRTGGIPLVFALMLRVLIVMISVPEFPSQPDPLEFLRPGCWGAGAVQPGCPEWGGRRRYFDWNN